MTPLSLAKAKSAAPALNRGLAILVMLANEGPLALDVLVARLRLPKASAFRLLTTLQEVGMIRKTPEKLYAARWKLQPLEDLRELYRQRVIRQMDALCQATGCTVEWYEPTVKGMKLMAQVNPECELRVQARPGFLRTWGDEFEAVCRLGYAFAEVAPPLADIGIYKADGMLKTIAAAEAQELLTIARESRSAADLPYNRNSVRRTAVAAFENQEFRGVLALAEAYVISRRSRTGTYLRQLTQTLETI